LLNPRLRELDIGDWAGLTRGQIERAAGAVLRRFDNGDLDVRPGGGENLREMLQRAHSAVSELVDAHPDRRLAVVTHLGVIRALFGEPWGFAASAGTSAVSSGPGADIGNAGWRRLDLEAFCDPAAREWLARAR
jgi:probable phosphoglycerate mutase